MTWSGDVRDQPSEFVYVFKLANRYIASHTTGNKTTFISQHPEKDMKVAEATAKLFAAARGIQYDDNLRVSNKPIYSIVKDGNNWYPIALYADKILLLANLGHINIGGNQEEATNMAAAIALSEGANFEPSIGISMSN